jgi:hypothetical protein
MVLLVAVLVRQSMIINELRNFQSNVGNVSYWLNTVDDQINRLSADLREMDKEDDLIQSMDFKYDSIESLNSTTSVDMTFTLNKTKMGDSVLMYYRPVDTEDWESIVLERIDGTEYAGSFISDYSCDYETKLVVDSDGTLYTESSQVLGLYSDSLPQYDWRMNPRQVSSDGTMTYEASLDCMKKWNQIEVVKATVEVYYQGKLLDEFELMEEEFIQFKHDDFIAWSVDRVINFEPIGEETDFSDFEWVITVEDSIGRIFEHRQNR